MPSLPEMLFGDNALRIQHTDGYGIEFNAIDALKRVNNMEDAVKVACAQEWQESRQDEHHNVLPKAVAGGLSDTQNLKQVWPNSQTELKKEPCYIKETKKYPGRCTRTLNVSKIQ